MTYDEVEIVANAGVQLREIAERLTLPASRVFEREQFELVSAMDAAALSISEVYGQLSALPIEVEGEASMTRYVVTFTAPAMVDIDLDARDEEDALQRAIEAFVEDVRRRENYSVRSYDVATAARA